VACRIRAGWVAINDGFDFACPFGGCKKSGNERERDEFGFHDCLEIKGILGYAP
jgi:aldehyde dehydrogenase (NAD+)